MARRARKPLALAAAFWDTSALIPLCVRQSNSAAAISLYRRFSAVVWWTTSVEIESGLARLVRMNQLSSIDWAKARRLASTLADSWSVIQPIESVRVKAVQLVERYDLRAADAFQLAAALEWCEQSPKHQPFFTADERLFQSALLTSFDAIRV
jgi:predicted nucleic acid-binding protein